MRDPKDPGTLAMPGLNLSNRQRQALLRERRKRDGLVARTYWVTPADDRKIRELLGLGIRKEKTPR